jgi:hypothetical protein
MSPAVVSHRRSDKAPAGVPGGNWAVPDSVSTANSGTEQPGLTNATAPGRVMLLRMVRTGAFS